MSTSAASNLASVAGSSGSSSANPTDNSTSSSERRSSSFSINTRRRSSLLSKNMLESEEHRYYRMSRAIDGSEQYKLSLSQSQGFLWNQDLFVSKYQQRMSSGSTADEEEQLSANEVKLHIIYPDELAIEDTSSEEEDNNEYDDPKSTARSNRW